MWTLAVSSIPNWPGMNSWSSVKWAPEHWAAKFLAHARSSEAWRMREIPGPLPWMPAEALDE